MGQPATVRTAAQHRRDRGMAGVAGNEKLTAMTGSVLLIGFAAEGLTIIGVHRFLFLHFVIGFLLIGPVLLKIASTLYRFLRYYAGSQSYVRKGPPNPILRVLGPIVILTSVGVIGSGVMLGVLGPGRGGLWLFLHKGCFVLWFGAMTVHVLTHAPRLPAMLSARYTSDSGRVTAVPGGAVRWLLLAASLAAGVGVAALAMQLSSGWGLGGL